MKTLVNIDEGHIGSLLNWGQGRRKTKRRKGWVPLVVLSHKEMLRVFVFLADICLNVSAFKHVSALNV